MPVNAEIGEMINDLEGWLGNAEMHVQNAPPGHWTQVLRELVLQLLTNSGNTIAVLLNPNTPPNLSPPDAGTIDRSIKPKTLLNYAKATLQLATQAKDEVHQPNPDQYLIGSRIKTIEHLLPEYMDMVEKA